MALTAEQRRNLPDDAFAVPGKRKLPLVDPNNPKGSDHVRMAWSQVDRTQGLTDGERAEARRRILRHAKSIGVDVSEWQKLAAAAAGLDAIDVDDTEDLPEPDQPTGFKIGALRFEAAAVDLGSDDGHSNKMPFAGVLTKLDTPSDSAPHGSGGKRIVLSKKAAEAAQSSLLHMGVNLTADLGGHNPKNKVGVITAASIDGDAFDIAGHIYKGDFPEEAKTIKAQRAVLGFSFEADNVKVADATADPLVITSLVFTGASILLKDKAAYRTTSLAASAAAENQDIDMTKEELAALLAESFKPILEANTATNARLDKIEAATKTSIEKMEASSAVRDAVEPHAKGLEDAADKMEAAKIGLHPEYGHVKHLRKMAESMRADAAVGKMPYSHPNGGMLASADTSAEDKRKAEEAAKAERELAIKAAADAAAKPLLDKISAMGTEIKDLKAKTFHASAAPERRTVPSNVQSQLKRFGIELDGDKKIPVAVFDKALKDGGVTNISQRMQIKAAAGDYIEN